MPLGSSEDDGIDFYTINDWSSLSDSLPGPIPKVSLEVYGNEFPLHRNKEME